MVKVFEENRGELTPEQVKQTEEQITLRQNEIKEFLLSEKAEYEKRLGVVS